MLRYRELRGFPCDMLFPPSQKRNLCTYQKTPTYFETWTRAYSYWNEEFIIPRSDLCIFDCSSSSSHDASGIPSSISRLVLQSLQIFIYILACYASWWFHGAIADCHQLTKGVEPTKNASFSQAVQYLLDFTVPRRAYVNTRHWNFELSVWESLRSSNIIVQWVSAVGYKCTKKLVMTSWSWSWRCVPCGQKHLADKGFDDRSSRRVMWLLDIGPRIYPHSYEFRTKEP